MKKHLVIAKHVNLLDEAIFLLYLMTKGEIGDLKLIATGEDEKEQELHNKKCDIITEIYQDVVTRMSGKKERIEYYFKERNAEFSTLAALALLWEFHEQNNRLMPYEERVQDLNEAQKVKIFADIIHGEEAANTPLENLQTLPDLIRFIENSPYDKDTKWEAIKIFNNQESYYNEVYQLVFEVIEIVSSKYEKDVAMLEQSFYEYWTNFQKDNDIITTIEDKLNIAWNSDKETIIIPLMFLPYGVTISISDPLKDTKEIMRISFLINKNFTIGDRRISKDDVVNVGKLFSDKSKVDILEFISNKPCYGKEIANELNLSTATISYHVNALLKIGFVKADLISNKVYYSIDKNRIAAYLDDVKEYFNKL